MFVLGRRRLQQVGLLLGHLVLFFVDRSATLVRSPAEIRAVLVWLQRLVQLEFHFRIFGLELSLHAATKPPFQQARPVSVARLGRRAVRQGGHSLAMASSVRAAEGGLE